MNDTALKHVSSDGQEPKGQARSVESQIDELSAQCATLEDIVTNLEAENRQLSQSKFALEAQVAEMQRKARVSIQARKQSVKYL